MQVGAAGQIKGAHSRHAPATEVDAGLTEHDHEHTGHVAHAEHAGHSEEIFKRPFWVSLILTIPVLIYADPIQEQFGYTAPQFPGSQYVGAVLGSIIYWYGGWVFLRGAVFVLPSWMGAVLMSLSTIIVALLPQTLRRLRRRNVWGRSGRSRRVPHRRARTRRAGAFRTADGRERGRCGT